MPREWIQMNESILLFHSCLARVRGSHFRCSRLFLSLAAPVSGTSHVQCCCTVIDLNYGYSADSICLCHCDAYLLIRAAAGLTIAGVLHFLQSEWGKHERDKSHWDTEKAALKVAPCQIPL